MHGITNSEFAEMLLHQNCSALRDRDRSREERSSGTSTPRQGKTSENNFNKSEFLFSILSNQFIFSVILQVIHVTGDTNSSCRDCQDS